MSIVIPDWKQFETIIADIHQELSPLATVLRNQRILGINSNTPRQCDVVIRQTIGPSQVLIVVECKLRSRSVDLPAMEAFIKKLEDVRAQKGVFVSNKGFSKPALTLARRSSIDALTYKTAESKHWADCLNLEKYSALIFYLEIENSNVSARMNSGVRASWIPCDLVLPLYDATGIEQSTLGEELIRAFRRIETSSLGEAEVQIEFQVNDDNNISLFVRRKNRLVPFTGGRITGTIRLYECNCRLEATPKAVLTTERAKIWYRESLLSMNYKEAFLQAEKRELTNKEWNALPQDSKDGLLLYTNGELKVRGDFLEYLVRFYAGSAT